MDALIERVHVLVKAKVEKLDSNSRYDLPPAIIDELINISQDNYVDAAFAGTALTQGMGFEATQMRIDMISNLLVKQPEQAPLTPLAHKDGVFEIPFTFLEHKYRHLVRVSINTDCGPINLNLDKHTQLNTILGDAFSKPSRKWKRIPFTIARASTGLGSSIYLYTNNKFTISTVDVEYIKQPRRAFIGGYNSIESSKGLDGYSLTDNAVNPEIDETFIDVLVNFVVREWEAMQTTDYQVAQNQIVSNL
jgi:hypothetical protein